MSEHSVVPILQDTTERDFTAHPADDAGCPNKDYRFGLYDRTHPAVTPEGLCLGVVGVEEFVSLAVQFGIEVVEVLFVCIVESNFLLARTHVRQHRQQFDGRSFDRRDFRSSFSASAMVSRLALMAMLGIRVPVILPATILSSRE